MEKFFERLENEQGLDNDDLVMIKDCLGKQKIKFKQLMATGELALTNDKLERISISQLGLRTAILAIIQNNQLQIANLNL